MATMLLFSLAGYVYARYVFEARHSLKCLIRMYGTVYLESPVLIEPSFDLVVTVIDTKEISELSSVENIRNVILTGPRGTVRATRVSLETRTPMYVQRESESPSGPPGVEKREMGQYWLRLLGLDLEETAGSVTATEIEIHYKDGLTEAYELGEVKIVPKWPEGYVPTSCVPYHRLGAGHNFLIALRAEPWILRSHAGPGFYRITQVDIGTGRYASVDEEAAWGIIVTREAWNVLYEKLSRDWHEAQKEIRESTQKPAELWLPADPSGYTVVLGLPVTLSSPSGLEEFILRPVVTLQGADGREITICQSGPSSMLQLERPISLEDCKRAFDMGWTYHLSRR